MCRSRGLMAWDDDVSDDVACWCGVRHGIMRLASPSCCPLDSPCGPDLVRLSRSKIHWIIRTDQTRCSTRTLLVSDSRSCSPRSSTFIALAPGYINLTVEIARMLGQFRQNNLGMFYVLIVSFSQTNLMTRVIWLTKWFPWSSCTLKINT